jgi:hypothetical protein
MGLKCELCDFEVKEMDYVEENVLVYKERDGHGHVSQKAVHVSCVVTKIKEMEQHVKIMSGGRA